MGKVLSVTVKFLNRFNIENRVHREIAKDKQVAAPKHKSTLQEIERINKEYPEIKKELETKDPVLDEHLKQVYLTSFDPEPKTRNFGKPSEKSRLPSNRNIPKDNELGFPEPDEVPAGKLSLMHVMKILAMKQGQPDLSVEDVAKQYNISKQSAGYLLNFYQSFNIYIPDKDGTPKLEADAKVKALKNPDPPPVLIHDGLEKKKLD